MLRTAVMLVGMAGAFVAGARTVYSALQQQVPSGTAFKFAPDPANIWSWHDTVLPNQSGVVRLPVLVDFDKNNKMDTEHQSARVLITDMQVSLPDSGNRNSYYSVQSVRLVDATGVRWNLTPRQVALFHPSSLAHSVHLSTPLVLPVASDLFVEVAGYTKHQAGDEPLTVTLIGRVVTI